MKKQTPTDKVSTLNVQIEQEAQTIANLTSNLERMREEKQRAEQVQAETAYRALSGGDTDAKRALEGAENTLARFEARARSAEIALQTAKEKLDALQAQKAEAYRETKKMELDEEADKLIEVDAAEAEKALTALVAVRDAMVQRTTRMDALAVEAGVEPGHRRCLKNFWRALEQRLNLNPVWLSKEARATFRQPIGELFQLSLRGGSDVEREETITEQKAG